MNDSREPALSVSEPVHPEPPPGDPSSSVSGPAVPDLDLARLRAVVLRAERRMRLQRALDAGVLALAAGLLGASIVVAGAKTQVLADPVARRWLIGCAAVPILVAVGAWLRRLPPLAGAIALDREAKLHDRLSTALTFGVRGGTDLSAFHRAAIEDGLAHLSEANPARAVPLAWPRESTLAVGMGLVLAVVAVLEIRRHIPIPPPPAGIVALEVDPDDLEPFEDKPREIVENTNDPALKDAAQDFNRLIEDIKRKRLDRNEVFRRLADLDSRLAQSGELDRKALEDALKKLGNELQKSDVTKEVGKALDRGDRKEAEKKLRELAAKLRDKSLKLSDDQKKALADALKKAASRDREKALAEMKEARDKVAADLERMRKEKEKNGGKETPEQERDRKNKERELERLDREEKAQSSGDRQLERLDRDLESAANDLMKDLGLSAQDLEGGAEEVNKMANDEMTQQEKEELRQRLRELHDLLVQQGKLTPEQMAKLKEFMKKARGGQGQGQGQGKGRKGKLGKFVPPGEGEPDEGDRPDKGDGPEGDQPQDWTLGPDGQPMPMPGMGAGAGQGGNGSPGADGKPNPGPGWGVGHDPKLLDKKTSNKVGTTDIQVAGAEAGQGPTRSQVIQGAADRGFVGRGYKKVYVEYKAVAEESLKQDEIPAGYRFYVRRYFDMIRPRETP